MNNFIVVCHGKPTAEELQPLNDLLAEIGCPQISSKSAGMVFETEMSYDEVVASLRKAEVRNCEVLVGLLEKHEILQG